MDKTPQTTAVGVRELRDHLSRWLDAVQEGSELVVTERGRPVARIVPVTGRSRLDALIEAGVVRPALEPAESAFARPPIPVKGSVVDVLLEQRRT
jgi:prevent-host-death family protein